MYKVELLYPEICNYYGNLSGLQYLQQSCKNLEIIETHYTDEPYFVNNRPDMICIFSMMESDQSLVMDKLKNHRERIKELIDDEVIFFAEGNAFELFGNEIVFSDRETLKCMGLFDFKASIDFDVRRHNSIYFGIFDEKGEVERKIVGYKSQFGHSEINYSDEVQPLFKTLRGVGTDGKEKSGEGIRYKNFIGTYVIGPLFIMNPDFAKYVLSLLGEKNPALKYEDVCYEAYNKRVEEYENPSVKEYYSI